MWYCVHVVHVVLYTCNTVLCAFFSHCIMTCIHCVVLFVSICIVFYTGCRRMYCVVLYTVCVVRFVCCTLYLCVHDWREEKVLSAY